MLDRPETHAQIRARIGRDVTETSARIRASRSDLTTHIIRTRALIRESRDLMAHVDVMLGRQWPPLLIGGVTAASNGHPLNGSEQDGHRSTLTCPDCGGIMRLVGIESDQQTVKLHILTFECRQGHVAVTRLPH